MSIEAINESAFSTQSDIWAFGVVLWEMFSMGQTPYPGIEIDQFIAELVKGVRCPKPKYSNHELYSLMLRCWAEQPERRPHFEVIRSGLGRMLNETKKETFAAMNDSFTQKYRKNFKPKTDFLSKFASPKIESMHRFEQTNQPTNDDTSGYLDMQSKVDMTLSRRDTYVNMHDGIGEEVKSLACIDATEEATNGFIQMQPITDSEVGLPLIMEADKVVQTNHKFRQLKIDNADQYIDMHSKLDMLIKMGDTTEMPVNDEEYVKMNGAVFNTRTD